MAFQAAFHLLRLYRLDAAVISAMSCAYGMIDAGRGPLEVALVSAAVSLLTFNFIYSYNAVADVALDRVNKPHRPLPAGTLSSKSARRYVFVVGALALAYPFSLRGGPVQAAPLWALVALGFAYSSHRIRLRNRPPISALVIATMYVLPMISGFAADGRAPRPDQLGLVASLFAFCLAVIPLKDIEDVEGDVRGGSGNWADWFGPRRLVLISCAGLLLTVGLTWALVRPIAPRLLVVAVSCAALVTIAFFLATSRPLRGLYRAVLVTVILIGGAYLAVLAARPFDAGAS